MAALPFQIELGSEFAGATFPVATMWGNGGNGVDLWGFPTNVNLEIDGPFVIDGKVVIVVKSNNPGHPDGTMYGLTARVVFANGKAGILSILHKV